MRSLHHLVFLIVLAVSFSACAVTRVKTVKDPLVVVVPKEACTKDPLVTLMRAAMKADRTDRKKGLGLWLDLTRQTEAAALSGKMPQRAIYNYACARVAKDLEEVGWGDLPASVETPSGVVGLRVASTTVPASLVTYLQPSANLRVIGMAKRHIRPGVGGALVASREGMASEKFVPRNGFFVPLTAVVSWRNPQQAEVVFYSPLRTDEIVVHGRKVPLAADYTAPLAAQLSRQKSQGVDLVGFLRPQVLFPDFGLFMQQPYDPTKIPVVFTHGLMSRPGAFRESLNTLQADPEIRKRYQFWYFRYPSGLPVAVTAARLRRDLDRALQYYDPKRQNPAFENTVLVGHSMGTIISNIQVRDRTAVRRALFTDPTKLVAFGTDLDEVVDLYRKPPAEQVSFLIFICGPHRGSDLAMNPVAQLFSTLVAVPRDLLSLAPGRTVNGLTTAGQSLVNRPMQSIFSLSPENKALEMNLEMPLSPRVTYASIIGDQGRGNTPNSSDGIVPYWSSHLDGAISEKIVPYTHDAQDRELTIAEMRRLLLEHARKVPLVTVPKRVASLSASTER